MLIVPDGLRATTPNHTHHHKSILLRTSRIPSPLLVAPGEAPEISSFLTLNGAARGIKRCSV